ncbi:DNA primase [Wenjunlia vitaminophila]|uniref:DNA primase n=1 Tax=Wenjunlia vitaminophila TaxID=76728 RepID=A0A0T6LN85_WENVI|nr:DNA primase [Wenjunlia vitaminophila]
MMSTDPIDGAALLTDVERFHRRFNAFPSEAAYVAVALWDAHTHLLDCFDSTPRLAFLSPEPGSGKTRALEVIATLVPRPMHAVNASPAALFRAVADQGGRPVILFDEIDTVFGPKTKGDNEDLRGLLNAGHRRSGVSYRCAGDGGTQTVVAFPSYCAVAMGGLGSLPDTILARSVIIRMRRRARTEKVEPYRHRIHEPQGNALRDRLADWAQQVRSVVDGVFPEMPDGITDRPADVWEPLLAVADAAGGDWPQRARDACVELVTAVTTDDRASLGVRLLTDLRDHIFPGETAVSTVEILHLLNGMEESPWGDLDGRPLNPRSLSAMLREYVTASGKPIGPRFLRIGGQPTKGYHRDDLTDAWNRYCPPPPETAVASVAPPARGLLISEDAATDHATDPALQP